MASNFFGDMKRNTENIINGLVALFGRISSPSVDGKLANVQVMHDADYRSIKVILPYGFASNMIDNIQVQCVGSDVREVKSVIGAFDENRPATEPGESLLYNNFGVVIKLGKDGVVNITAKNATINGIPIVKQGDTASVNDLTINGGATVGGVAVARKGDTVQVEVPTHGTCTGKIV